MAAYIDDFIRIFTAACALTAAIISIRNAGRIHQVHVSINSRMDQLLTERGIAARAEGVIEGQQKSITSVPSSD